MKMRIATHAGSWYPNDRQVLISLFDQVSTEGQEPIKPAKIVIVPHAGYRYSLKTALHAYKALAVGGYRVVVVMGFSHHHYLEKPLMGSGFDAMETPLGAISVEKPFCKSEYIGTLRTSIDEQEHSLEMQYPLVKHFLPDCKIVPLMVSEMTTDVLGECSRIVSSLLSQPDTCLVVSSDFCHWGRNYRFSPNLKGYGDITLSNRIRAMDMEAIFSISSEKVGEFKEHLERTGNTICGRNPIILAMQTISLMGLRGEWKLLDYSHSSVIHSADSDESSVSYVSMGYFL